MAVAKSYENMKIMGEPYSVDNKMYVMVQGPCKRCGGSGHYSMNASGDTTCYRCHGMGKENMEVRWYTDKQREALDRAAEKRQAAAKVKQEERRVKFAARNALDLVLLVLLPLFGAIMMVFKNGALSFLCILFFTIMFLAGIFLLKRLLI